MDEILREMAGNKKIIFKGYIEGIPKESDMELRLGEKIKLEVLKGSGAFLIVEGFGVCKVIDPHNPDFKPGDRVSGFTG
ncbi:hypothetical protein OROHE_008308 [Orobanche hederae]